MVNRLEQEIGNYQQRRDAMLGGLEAYRGWLDRYADMDAEQTLRLYDLADTLKQDRLVLAQGYIGLCAVVSPQVAWQLPA